MELPQNSCSSQRNTAQRSRIGIRAEYTLSKWGVRSSGDITRRIIDTVEEGIIYLPSGHACSATHKGVPDAQACLAYRNRLLRGDVPVGLLRASKPEQNGIFADRNLVAAGEWCVEERESDCTLWRGALVLLGPRGDLFSACFLCSPPTG